MSQDIQSIESILNLSEAMENLDGDAELLQEIMEIFLEIVPEQMDELASNIQNGQVKELGILAHGLKGSASNFCASKFVITALKLERLAKTGSLEGAEELLQQLKGEFVSIQEILPVINWEEVTSEWNS